MLAMPKCAMNIEKIIRNGVVSTAATIKHGLNSQLAAIDARISVVVMVWRTSPKEVCERCQRCHKKQANKMHNGTHGNKACSWPVPASSISSPFADDRTTVAFIPGF